MRRYLWRGLIALVAVVVIGGGLVNHLFPYVFVRVKPLHFGRPESSTPVSSQWIDYSNEYLEVLRAEYGLEEMIRDAVSDIERVAIIVDWVHNLWKHHGSNTPEEQHPLYILRAVAEGERFRCVEYGVVIAGCLQAIGIPARTIGLQMKDVETRASSAGHVATEAYLFDMNKWVFVDGQWNAIPFLESNNTPLNAVELQAAIAHKEPITFPHLSANQLFYKKWITPYLYYFDVSAGGRVMLAPEGASEPKVFQRKWPLDVAVFTHSVQDFYARPLRREDF